MVVVEQEELLVILVVDLVRILKLLVLVSQSLVKVVLVAVGGKVIILQLEDLVAVDQDLVLVVPEQQDKALLAVQGKELKVVHT